MKRFRLFLISNKIAPKWVIFALDITISCFAISYAFLLRFNFDLSVIHPEHVVRNVIVVVVINSTLFNLFKTFQGIIRFSSFQEAFRSIAAIFYSFLILLIVNVVMYLIGAQQLTPISVLFIYFFIACFILLGYRVFVKYLYNTSTDNQETEYVVIYGAEGNGSVLKKTIEEASSQHYKIIAFIDDANNLIGKSIDGVRIYGFNEIKTVFKEWKITLLFFAKQDFEFEEKNRIVEFCLESGVKVMNIPPMKDWIQGHLNINQLREVKIEELLGRPPINLYNEHVIEHLRDKRVLITGAAGSIGSELARQLSAVYPTSLIICDQTETGLYELEYELQQKYKLGNALKVFLGDVKDAHGMNSLFGQYLPQVVFHAAAYKHVPMMEKYPSEAIRNNVQGTKTIADLSEIYGAEKFVLVSTDKAINPTNIMGASKRIAEIYCQSLQKRREIPVWDDGFIG